MVHVSGHDPAGLLDQGLLRRFLLRNPTLPVAHRRDPARAGAGCMRSSAVPFRGAAAGDRRRCVHSDPRGVYPDPHLPLFFRSSRSAVRDLGPIAFAGTQDRVMTRGGLCVNNVMKDVPIIAIVDDDASIRRSLLRVVQSGGYQGETFASAREFLDWLPRNQAACLV